MGLKRFVWRSTSAGRIIDTVSNMVEEGSITEGFKRTLKEDLCEDNPLTKPIYDTGKYDGQIEGYNQASAEYEEKLLKQAEEFLKQKDLFIEQREAYEELLDAYDKEIEELKNKMNRTQEETDYFEKLLLSERQLVRLKIN